MQPSRLRLESSIYKKLAARSYFAAPVYLVLFWVVVSLTPIFRDHRSEVLVFATLLTTAALLRLSLTYKLLKEITPFNVQWKRAFTFSILLTSMTWGAFCFFTISRYGMSATTFTLLFPTAGIIGATVVSLALSPKLLVGHVFSTTTPIIVACMLKWDEGGMAYVILASIYLAYLLLQAKVVSKTALTEIESSVIIAQQKGELELAWKDALDAAKVKSQFLALMSHEMRTPLNGILGVSELMQEEELSSKTRGYAKTIQECSQNLLAMVDDILGFSEVESGAVLLQPTPFNLKKTVSAAIKPLERKAVEKGLGFNLEIAGTESAELFGDAKRLQQILSHLVANAIKFTVRGSVSVHVHHEALNETTQKLIIVIADTGIGMSAQTIASLFQPFSPADNSSARSHEGAGLGLALCQRFAELMGGQVTVTSAADKGSVFTLTVPFALNNEPAAVSEPEAGFVSPEVLNPANGLANCRVLVVEDNVTNQTIILAMLKKLGLVGEVVSNGIECLNALAEHEYHLILMDCRMPEMDGYETTRLIRLQDRYKNTPIIAVTANALKGDRERCFAVGMTNYLTKPVKFPVFAETIQSALRDFTSQQAILNRPVSSSSK